MYILNKAKSLKLGDTIGLVSPSSSTSIDNVKKSQELLIEMGFKVKIGKSPYEKYGYLSGSDEIRANDINNMFKDQEVDAIICLRGGYGSPRLLDLIDYDLVKNNPKIFVGYSDITALHIAFTQISNLITFHGPMLTSDMIGTFSDFSKENLFGMIMNTKEINIISNPEGEEIKTINGGKAQGTIIGGNLSLIAASLGTPYEIDLKDKILFIEEVGEEPYSIDRMLNQLRLAGKFEELSGIIFGDFKDCEPKKHDESLPLEQIITDLVKASRKPIISNLKAGHCEPMVTIPFGTKARLDADKKELKILESPVI